MKSWIFRIETFSALISQVSMHSPSQCWINPIKSHDNRTFGQRMRRWRRCLSGNPVKWSIVRLSHRKPSSDRWLVISPATESKKLERKKEKGRKRDQVNQFCDNFQDVSTRPMSINWEGEKSALVIRKTIAAGDRPRWGSVCFWQDWLCPPYWVSVRQSFSRNGTPPRRIWSLPGWLRPAVERHLSETLCRCWSSVDERQPMEPIERNNFKHSVKVNL